MSEISSCFPILGLIVASISAIVAILTYLRVSRKYLSKTLPFNKDIKANEKHTLFKIDGSGSLQRLEMTARGSQQAKIVLIVDGEMCLIETFASLNAKASRYLVRYIVPNPQESSGMFSIDIDLQKNFYKSLELLIDNNEENISIGIIGAVHFNIREKRGLFSMRKPL